MIRIKIAETLQTLQGDIHMVVLSKHHPHLPYTKPELDKLLLGQTVRVGRKNKKVVAIEYQKVVEEGWAHQFIGLKFHEHALSN